MRTRDPHAALIADLASISVLGYHPISPTDAARMIGGGGGGAGGGGSYIGQRARGGVLQAFAVGAAAYVVADLLLELTS